MSSVITLRVPEDTVAHLDALARQRGATRTQVILSAVEDAIARDGERRAAALEDARARLRAPLQAQADFLEETSFADEWRPF